MENKSNNHNSSSSNSSLCHMRIQQIEEANAMALHTRRKRQIRWFPTFGYSSSSSSSTIRTTKKRKLPVYAYEHMKKIKPATTVGLENRRRNEKVEINILSQISRNHSFRLFGKISELEQSHLHRFLDFFPLKLVSYVSDQTRLTVENNWSFGRSIDQAGNQIADACIKQHWIYLVVLRLRLAPQMFHVYSIRRFNVDFAKRSAWSCAAFSGNLLWEIGK